MMKTTLLTALALAGSLSFAQKDVNLNLIHNFNGTAFAYNQTYTTSAGTAVLFERVQYYLSGFELTHDGGQTLAMADQYILGSATDNTYDLGNRNVSTVEGLNFDLGVDYNANHMGTSLWPSGHPLASQIPGMDWGWPSGYFFFVIEGKVDNTGDGVPDKIFQFHGIGDNLLRDVNGFSGLNLTGNEIDITLDVNIADWVKNLDLAAVGYDHSGGPNNMQVADNTNDETVFTMGALGIDDLEAEENKIYANYESPYAPSIFYNLATNTNVDVRVYSLEGKLEIESKDHDPDGNFFINKELRTGSYIITFSNHEMEESFRFVVRQ